ncbi:TonB-dependent receptor plug domain-containing protein [Nitratireductor soli]|uniref:TonB-dependent receptor plug domain-containing protein n=1 Tax=Nitratireductor soli TaxID=1670619 RepID=UPI00065E8BC8|nr:TonB-dependent receptor [Nitratireductor soli]
MLSRLQIPPYLIGVSTLMLAVPVLPAAAQDFDLGTIVVTPNRAPTDRSKVGSSVAVVDSEEIEAQSLPVIVEYLDLLPGVSISSPGGRGAEGSLSVRGAPRRYVKTLYNGIDISDPTNTQVQTSYQYLLSGGIDRIEVLKGSQSTLYGSDAIAGVISLSTFADVEPGIAHVIQGEGGSHGTLSGSYGLRAANEQSKLSLNVIGFRTDGISSAAAGTERDGYENITFDANVEHAFSDVFSVFASGLYIDAEAEFDDDGAVPGDNPDNTNFSKQLAGRIGFNLNLMDGRFTNSVSLQGFNIERDIYSTTYGPYNGTFEGTRVKADYQGGFEINERLALQFGADYEQQNAKYADDSVGSTPTDDSFHQAGAWLQANLQPVDNLHVSLGLRHDDHSGFGGHTTYRFTGAYLIPDLGTRLHASLGTGYRAPSLYELYAGFGTGNPDLQPETSFGFDFGVEQKFLDERITADVTYFQLDIDDLIDCVPTGPFSCQYRQIAGTSRQRGVEASLTYAVNDWLELGGAYTYTRSVDQNDMRLPRVPRHAIGLTAAVRPAEKWTLSATARANIDTVDTGGAKLDDYLLVNAKLAYKPTEDSELYLRAENLLDQRYQTARGFNSPGFSVFAGFKAKFKP